MKRDGLLGIKQVANRLGFGRTKTYALLASGEIPSKRFGKGPKAHYRVEPAAVEKWIASQRSTQPATDLVVALKSMKTRRYDLAKWGLTEKDESFVN